MSEPTREVTVPSDSFEVVGDDAILAADLASAIAVCLYDAVEEAGALLHLKCAAADTDTTLGTELLLLDRCVASMRETAPAARNLQVRIIVHFAEQQRTREVCDSLLSLVRQSLRDMRVRELPTDFGKGPPRQVRFRPSMGWVHVS